MSTKHVKLPRPSNRDLERNPLIGGSRGVTMAQATPDDLVDLEGENTFVGDIENDTTGQGGIDEPARRRGRPDLGARTGKSRHTQLQGRKTHEQQLRILERKADVLDARQIEQEIARAAERSVAGTVKPNVRQSEFPVSRGGMNQESQHNKHNHPGQSGHKPQKPEDH